VDTGCATKPQHWAGEVIALGGWLQRGPLVFIHRVMGGKDPSCIPNRIKLL